MTKQIHLWAFLQGIGFFPTGWRHPRARPEGVFSMDYYASVAKMVEDARFDAIVFGDQLQSRGAGGRAPGRLAMPTLDPVSLLMAMAAVTERVGLVATVSTTYNTPEMLAAAWLHDTVEDTGVSLGLIEQEFGSEVASIVEMLTDVSCAHHGLRAHRKQIDREHTAKASPSAKTIKLADLIDNTRSIVARDPKFAEVYLAEKRLLLEVLREGDPALYAEAARIAGV